MSHVTEKSFNIALQTLSFTGLYQDGKNRFVKARAFLTYCGFVWFSMGCAANLYLNIDQLTSRNLTHAVLTIIVYLSAFFKFLPFLANATRIKNCVNYFGTHFIPRGKKEREIFEECVEVCSKVTKVYSGAIIFSLIFWCLLKLHTHDLPLDTWLPYNPKSGPLIFYSTFIFYSVRYVGQTIEPLIGGLVYQAVCQMRILKYNLQNLDQHSLLKTVKLCVVHHNAILNFIHEFKKCFSLCILGQITGVTFVLSYCCIGIILMGPTSQDGVMFIAIYLCSSFQLLFYCYCGMLLFEENEGLINAIYMSPWYKYDVKIIKLLMFIMESSKKPVILTAGAVINLTPQTFTAIIKTSYSLVAVMNTR